jgi:hypothetical protein
MWKRFEEHIRNSLNPDVARFTKPRDAGSVKGRLRRTLDGSQEITNFISMDVMASAVADTESLSAIKSGRAVISQCQTDPRQICRELVPETWTS